jgi:hypothetical protein
MSATRGGPPRKKMATYGKAVRRRIPDYSFTPKATKSQPLDAQSSASYLSKFSETVVEDPAVSPPRSRLTTPFSPSSPQTKADIFDVPSSDEEKDTAAVKPAARSKARTTVVKLSKRPSPKRSHNERSDSVEDNNSKKRVKLSPVSSSSVKAVPSKVVALESTISSTSANTIPTNSLSSQANSLRKTSPTTVGKQRLQGLGHVSTIAARPKPKAQRNEGNLPLSPKKTSSGAAKPLQDSTPVDDIDMIDVDVVTKPQKTSQNGGKSRNGMLQTTRDKPKIQKLSQGSSNKQKVTSFATQSNEATIQTNQQTQSRAPRRRLIDSLVEQKADSESSDDNDSGDDSTESVDSNAPFTATNDFPESQTAILEEHVPTNVVSGSQNSQSQPIGPRFTYSKQRSMLVEEDLMKQLALDMPVTASGSQGRKHRRGSIPNLPQLPSYHEDVDEDENSGAAIRNVHELRQAGANSRFMDEVDDLLDRIGSPNGTQKSLRRSGLLDMASQLKDKSFARQFRSNHVEQRLFVHLGQETDIIAGYVLVYILMTVLIEGSVPSFVAQLRRQGITRLLIRLLDGKAGIVAVAKDRKSNATKIAQKMIVDHHDHLLKLLLWEDLQPEILSPRTVALKCLEIMVRQTREAGNANDIFSKELTTNLFTIIKSASDEIVWQLPRNREAVDYHLALSALESHSIRARTVQDETIWLTDYLPIISDTLLASLSRPLDSFGVLQVLILRLTLNVTNNNPKATDIFARNDLMAAMGQVIVAKLEQISRFMIEEELSVVVDHLVLVLGAMINFAEWSLPARQSLQSLSGASQDYLAAMIRIFTVNYERMSEVSCI